MVYRTTRVGNMDLKRFGQGRLDSRILWLANMASVSISNILREIVIDIRPDLAIRSGRRRYVDSADWV